MGEGRRKWRGGGGGGGGGGGVGGKKQELPYYIEVFHANNKHSA